MIEKKVYTVIVANETKTAGKMIGVFTNITLMMNKLTKKFDLDNCYLFGVKKSMNVTPLNISKNFKKDKQVTIFKENKPYMKINLIHLNEEI